MPPRVAYWLSSFDPDMEAVAGEVALLRRQFAGSVAWGLNYRRWGSFSWRRGFSVHPRGHLLLRAMTCLLEPLFHVNHVFGSLGEWHYLRANRLRPVILTLATHSPPVADVLLEHVRVFVAEEPAGREILRRQGIKEGRIRLIFPPADLRRFAPAPRPPGPFTVLFASSPDAADHLEARGVYLLLDTAALRPFMRFRLLWRPWGDSLARVRHWINKRGLANVDLCVGRFADMAAEYARAHVTAVPFLSRTFCKPAPNSLVESLAAGRPVLLTSAVGLAETVAEERAGLVGPATAAGLAAQLDRLRGDWVAYSRRARRLAERCFDRERFLEGHRRLYSEVLARPHRT